MLYSLWLLVPVAFLLVHAYRRKLKAASRFVEPAMAGRLMPVFGGLRPWARGALLLLALTSLGIATAGPRWGVYFEEVSQRGADIMVLLDISRSMLSQDVVPSRLQRAKSDIQDLLRKVKGDRVGLIAFAGKPAVVCPLTIDQGFFRMILDQVGPESAPRGGTAMGDAIQHALRVMDKRHERDQALLLITDGEDQDSFPLEAASIAADRGMKIFTVGLGDPVEGARVPVVDSTGNRTYLKYQGQEIWSKMDERLLQEIALRTQGAYVPARTQAYDLGEVYENHLAALATSEIQAEKRKRYRERFQLFVGLGVLLFLLEMLVSPYPRQSTIATSVTFVLIFTTFVPVALASDAGEKVEEGIARFGEGKLDEASRLLAEADVSLPGNWTIVFDKAVVLQVQGNADEARSLYLEAALAQNPVLAARAQYNLGTLATAQAQAIFGDQPEDTLPESRAEGMALLQGAVQHFRTCLELDPNYQDARHNLELLRLWLKHMTATWAEQDRERQRNELGLIPFLEMLMQSQKGLHQEVAVLHKEADSPRRQQALQGSSSAQQQLSEEIEPLKQKIGEAFETPSPGVPSAPAGAAPGIATPGAEELKQVQETLEGWANEAGEAMVRAAHDIEGALLPEAMKSQHKAFRQLDRTWGVVVPFERVLEQATTLQTGIVEETIPLVERSEDEAREKKDLPQLAEDQSRVKELAVLLPLKAQQGLKQLESLPMSAEASDEEEQARAALETQQSQIEGLRQAYQKAMDLSPRIQKLTAEAASDLGEANPQEALPKEEQALKLLQEIAENLPKNPRDQEKQNQEKQNRDQQDQNQQEQSQQAQQQARQQQLSREQAEALLRKAAERERQHRQKRQAMERGLLTSPQVERDW